MTGAKERARLKAWIVRMGSSKGILTDRPGQVTFTFLFRVKVREALFGFSLSYSSLRGSSGCLARCSFFSLVLFYWGGALGNS